MFGLLRCIVKELVMQFFRLELGGLPRRSVTSM